MDVREYGLIEFSERGRARSMNGSSDLRYHNIRRPASPFMLPPSTRPRTCVTATAHNITTRPGITIPLFALFWEHSDCSGGFCAGFFSRMILIQARRKSPRTPQIRSALLSQILFIVPPSLPVNTAGGNYARGGSGNDREVRLNSADYQIPLIRFVTPG